jgi:type I restriction enzyme, S subunit
MIPEGWKRATVGELCHFSNGNGFKPGDWSDHGLPIIRIQNLNGSNDFNYYSGEVKEKWIVEPGQLLFAWAGTKGVSFGPKIWKGNKGVLNQHIFKVEPSRGVLGEWLYEALVHVTDVIEKKAHGFKATLLHVQKSDITEQVVPLPPEDEQRKIAHILSTWDEAIIATENLLNASQQQKRSLMQQLLTGKKRLPKFVSQPGYRHERYGDVPIDWGFVEIGNFSSQRVKKNSGEKNFPVLSCTKHEGFVGSLSYFNKKVYSDNLSGYKLIEKMEFGFPANHIEEGSIGLQKICDIGLVSPIYVIFKVEKSKADPDFLHYLLKTDLYRQVFASSTNSSVDRRGSLRWKEFSQIKVVLPPLEEQKAIASVLFSADSEIDDLQQKLEFLRQEKKALMQQLLTGKRRVRVEEEEEAIV